MYNSNELRIVHQLQVEIETELNRVGLLFRVFSRAKTQSSIQSKLNKEPNKYSDLKKIQDIFGIRIILYFPDDLNIAQRALVNKFTFDSSTIDDANTDLFSATRCNYIFKLPQGYENDSTLLKDFSYLDNTFEVQFRTILSEGWHEVEHDLRYKCKNDWDKHQDLSRALNGIYASLETSDWGMMKLFEELAYRHYKESNWSAMLRTKLRLRTTDKLNQDIINIIEKDKIGKLFYRIDREKVLSIILEHDIDVPINLQNLVYISNYHFIKNNNIKEITPSVIIRKLQEGEDKFNFSNKKKS